MEKETLNDLFNNLPVYTKRKFEIITKEGEYYNINQEKISELALLLDNADHKLIARCNECDDEYPFSYACQKIDVRGYEDSSLSLYLGHDGSARYGVPVYGSSWSYSKTTQTKKPITFNEEQFFLLYTFKCSRNGNHIYAMFLFIKVFHGSVEIIKVGQNPSQLLIQGYDFDEYRKVLKSFNAYEDYKKAEICRRNDCAVGAYAYLRRVFEFMINSFLPKDMDIKAKMEDKLKVCIDKIYPEIQKYVKNVYKILSESIHLLDEGQSKEYYTTLKAFIDMQLEYMKTEREKEQKLKKYSTDLAHISDEVFNPKNIKN